MMSLTQCLLNPGIYRRKLYTALAEADTTISPYMQIKAVQYITTHITRYQFPAAGFIHTQKKIPGTAGSGIAQQ
jgi:hypothetical protein